MAKITKRFIDTVVLPPGPAIRHFYDTDLPGFVLTVRRGRDGKISRRFNVRYGLGRGRKWMSIGHYGVLTVEEARAKAKGILAEVSMGGDPGLAKKLAAQVPLFSEWIEEYLENATRRTKAPRLIRFHLSRAAEKFGQKRISEVTTPIVMKAFREIGAEAPVSANRWLTTLSACFAKAIKTKLVKENPCEGIEPYRESPGRRRVLSKDELIRLMDALEKEPDVFVRAAVRLCLETGARIGEVLHARWADFEMDGLLWQLPDPKAGTPQDIEITAYTAAWLKELPRYGPFVIQGKNPLKPRADLKGGWERVRTSAGLPDVSLHDLRRTVSDLIIRERGLFVASQVLRHSDVNVTSSHYSGRTPGERRDALESVVVPLVRRKTG